MRNARDIVRRMTLEEKVFLMSGQVPHEQVMEHFKQGRYNHVPYPAGGNERLNVPAMQFVDGPRGVVSGNGTCFPVPMGRGATFDPALERRIGQAIGREVRAVGGNLFGGVCVNLPRHPGWGRSQETYGEDSYHLGVMGAALVEGVQAEGVIACVKHFAFNSMENARFTVNVTADKRTEREVYLPHFKACVDAGAGAVMSAYNRYDGDYCGHSGYLLNQVLKEEWGFDGFVLSDFVWGIRDTAAAAGGGVDIEMCDTKYYGDRLVEAVRCGEVSEAVVDRAAERIVRTLLAFAETQAGEAGDPRAVMASQAHVGLALEAAEKSMTLLQNDDQTLPFAKSVRKVAVIGKLGNRANIGDHGSSRVHPPYVVTPLEGIRRLLPDAEVVYDDGTDIRKASALAQTSDAVVFVVGYDHDDEGERISSRTSEFKSGGDRQSLGLHADEIELLTAAGLLNRRSVAVLIGGSTILIEEWRRSVAAILMAYYPGMEGGTAIARTLFGDVNPGGKLPYVTPADANHLPGVDWEATEIAYGYYHGYAKLDKEGVAPGLPYGFGLSYTTFRLSDPSFEATGSDVVATCTVENTGDREGDEVVQLYVGYGHSRIDRPVKSLRGFERITLKPGQRRRVRLACPIERLRWFNPDSDAWELESMPYEVFIGTSSAREDLLAGTVELAANADRPLKDSRGG